MRKLNTLIAALLLAVATSVAVPTTAVAQIIDLEEEVEAVVEQRSPDGKIAVLRWVGALVYCTSSNLAISRYIGEEIGMRTVLRIAICTPIVALVANPAGMVIGLAGGLAIEHIWWKSTRPGGWTCQEIDRDAGIGCDIWLDMQKAEQLKVIRAKPPKTHKRLKPPKFKPKPPTS